MQTSIDIHVHDIKRVIVERAYEKGLIRIHLVSEGSDYRNTVLRVWSPTAREWPELEVIDEKPERIVIESEDADP